MKEPAVPTKKARRKFDANFKREAVRCGKTAAGRNTRSPNIISAVQSWSGWVATGASARGSAGLIFHSRSPICQRRLSAGAWSGGPGCFHEPQGQLLRQRRDGGV